MGIKDVWAVRDCTVICVKYDDGKRAYGNTVYLEDEDGNKTMYAHLDWIAVKVGQRLKRWDVFAEIGDTGYCPSGAHLHTGRWLPSCEELFSYTAIDPLSYFEKYGFPCHTRITNYFGSRHFNDKKKNEDGETSLKSHEGLDFSSWRIRDENT